MGLSDIPFWGRVAAELANVGLDRMGARACATRGHRWRNVKAIVLREDGGVEERARGAAQRCSRCGATREKPEE
ncbi:MAG TPA: hypothetical protein VFQ25_10945 [Ktedonobacterales bacterium]|nr:hypothetical protein [Ktedonobacterales bacterium]